VRAILANPRYTGRQVWNRQPASHDLIDPANTGLGHRQVQRWTLPDGWIISARPSHPALVSEEDFITVQGLRAERDTGTAAGRRYLLAGLLRCGICGRRLESCWANNRPAYRCRHGHSSAATPDPARPKNLYIREDHILPHVAALHVLLTSTEPAAGQEAPHPAWNRRPAPGHRGGHHQLPAVPRDHSHLPPPDRNPAGKHPGSRDHRDRPRKLTQGRCAPTNRRNSEGRSGSPDKSPGTSGSLGPGDVLSCPETDVHVQISCPRPEANL